MNTDTVTTTTVTTITCAQGGFSGRRAKWRVAAATSEGLLTLDARSAQARAAIASGDLRVTYLRGTRQEAAVVALEMAAALEK
jgi:hypothetical protein